MMLSKDNRQMRDVRQAKRVVTKTLSDTFGGSGGVRILDVRVDDDVDADGNPVLRIFVIFEGDLKNLDAKKLSGVVRELRPKLYRINETAFPLLSFISKAEIGPSTRAPA